VSEVDVATDPFSDASRNSPPFYPNQGSNPELMAVLKYAYAKQPPSDLGSTSELEDFILKQVVGQFPAIEVAIPLFEIFQQYGETNYFYFDRQWFKESIQSFYATAPASGAGVGCDIVCLMLVVLATSSQFTYLNQMRGYLSPDAARDENPWHIFYQLSQMIMPRVIAMGTLPSIQACLIAAVYLMSSDQRNTAYVYLGVALRMAIASHMHRNTHRESYSSRLSEIRNRVFWTIYLNER
jgi:hypothetical protein